MLKLLQRNRTLLCNKITKLVTEKSSIIIVMMMMMVIIVINNQKEQKKLLSPMDRLWSMSMSVCEQHCAYEIFNCNFSYGLRHSGAIHIYNSDELTTHSERNQFFLGEILVIVTQCGFNDSRKSCFYISELTTFWKFTKYSVCSSEFYSLDKIFPKTTWIATMHIIY